MTDNNFFLILTFAYFAVLCLAILFMLYQGWQVVAYLHRRFILREDVKFPTASLFLFLGCNLLYILALFTMP